MKNKWLILVAIALVAIPVLSMASPASACVNGWTPGYWKNHPLAWRVYDPVDPGATRFNDVFTPGLCPPGYGSNPTLMAMLNKGGGGIYAFGRQAAAQLLNTTKLDGTINFHTTWFIGLCNAIYAAYKTNPNAYIDHSDSSFVMRHWNVEQWKNYIESFHIY